MSNKRSANRFAPTRAHTRTYKTNAILGTNQQDKCDLDRTPNVIKCVVQPLFLFYVLHTKCVNDYLVAGEEEEVTC